MTTLDFALNTVLFVDSDPAELRLAAKTLSGEPYRLLTERDPIRALPTVEWELPDVVVSGMRFPQLDGVDLMIRVRQLFPWVQRILLGTPGPPESLVRAINDAEVYRVLTRPVSDLDLRRAIRSALTRAAALRQLRASEEAATRSQQALADVERRYPGIGSAELVDGAYVLSADRVAELVARLHGSLLEPLLDR